jgi:hypothetical protein
MFRTLPIELVDVVSVRAALDVDPLSNDDEEN